jgi:hypothetical protein
MSSADGTVGADAVVPCRAIELRHGCALAQGYRRRLAEAPDLRDVRRPVERPGARRRDLL